MMGVSIYFSPRSRGEADDLVRGVEQSIPVQRADIDIVSHALGYRPLVDRLAACRALGSRVRIMLEGANMVESVGGDHWSPGGDAEPLREAVCALWRSNIPVRLDRRSALLHANLILSSERKSIFVTSANLTADGLDKHHGCGIEIIEPSLYAALHDEYDALWGGSYESEKRTGRRVESADGGVAIHVGARVGIESELCGLVASARRRVRFAMFTFSTGVRELIKELAAAAARGGDVAGVVDGDQAGQPFDAVPELRAAGIDVRYVPGALTGGRGRMHHKLVVVDGQRLAMGTYNLTTSASSNYEAIVALQGPAAEPLCAAAEAEIEVLFGTALAAMPSFRSLRPE